MAADVQARAGRFTVGAPKPLFRARFLGPGTIPVFADAYAPADNGNRFLINELVQEPQAPPLTVVVNWAAGLKK